MRRLVIDVFLLGLVSGVACGLALTACEIAYSYWWLGYNLDLFGHWFEGSDGDVTYPVVRNFLFITILACQGGWLTWGVAAKNRRCQGAAAGEPAGTSPQLRRSAWITAIFYAILAALLWASMAMALSIAAVRPFQSIANFVRLMVLSAAIVACMDRFRYCWKGSDDAVKK